MGTRAPTNAQEQRGYVFMTVARNPAYAFAVAFLIPYTCGLAKHHVDEHGRVQFVFMSMVPSSVPTAIVIIAAVFSMFLNPIMGAIADLSSYRRRLMVYTSYGAAAAFTLCSVVFKETFFLGGICLFCIILLTQIASFLSNSYLPEIAGQSVAGHVRRVVACDDRPSLQILLEVEARCRHGPPNGRWLHRFCWSAWHR